MALKKTTGFARTNSLKTTNLAEAQSPSLTKEQKLELQSAVYCLAEMLDTLAKGEATHITIGKPKNGQSFLITLNISADEKMYSGFLDIFEVGTVVRSDFFELPG